MATLRELINKIGFDVDQNSWNQANKKMDSMISKGKQLGQNMTLAITLPFVTFAGLAAKAASDIKETDNLFKQVFGDLADSAQSFATGYANSLRRIDTETKLALSQFQAFLVGMGMGREEALNNSKLLVKAAGDMSSAWNKTAKEMNGRFLSAMSGSSEVMDQFGINLKVSALEQEALNQGIKKSVTKMSELEKATLRIAIIQKTLTRQGITGDAVRTSKEFANAMRSLTDQIKGFTARVGQQLIPILEPIVNKLVDMLSAVNKMNPAFIRFGLIVGGILAAIAPLILAFTTLVGLGGFITKGFIALKAAFSAAGVGIGALTGKFLLIVGAVTAAIAIIGLFIDELIVYFKGGETIIGKFLTPWEELKPKIMKALNPIITLLRSWWSNIRAAISGIISFIKAFINDDMEGAADALVKVIENMLKASTKLLIIGFSVLGKILFGLLKTLVTKLPGFLASLAPKIFDSFIRFIVALAEKIKDRVIGEGKRIGAEIKNSILSGDILKGFLNADIGKFTSFIGAGNRRAQEGLRGAMGEKRAMSNTNNTMNINATVKAEVSGANSEEQKAGLENAAKNSVEKILSKIKLTPNFPVFE